MEAEKEDILQAVGKRGKKSVGKFTPSLKDKRIKSRLSSVFHFCVGRES